MIRSTLAGRWFRKAWCLFFATYVVAGTPSATSAAETTDSVSPAPPPVKVATAGSPAASAAEDALANRGLPGVLLGVGIGGVIPGGEINDGVLFSDVIDSFLLGRAEAGYRWNELLMAGLYFEGGTGSVNTSELPVCDGAGIECNAGLVRIGVHARAYLPTASRFQPWGGAGLGYEWFAFNATADDTAEYLRVRANGAERLQLSMGFDIWSFRRQVITLLLGYSLGKYDQVTVSDSYYGASDPEGGVHHSVTMSATYGFVL